MFYVQIDEETGQPTNKRGLYVKKRRRTFRNMLGNNHRFKTIGKSKNMNQYFNCQFEPMMCGKWDKDDYILKRYPIEPLHIFLLGSPNDLLGLLKDEKDSEGNLIHKGSSYGRESHTEGDLIQSSPNYLPTSFQIQIFSHHV